MLHLISGSKASFTASAISWRFDQTVQPNQKRKKTRRRTSSCRWHCLIDVLKVLHEWNEKSWDVSAEHVLRETSQRRNYEEIWWELLVSFRFHRWERQRSPLWDRKSTNLISRDSSCWYLQICNEEFNLSATKWRDILPESVPNSEWSSMWNGGGDVFSKFLHLGISYVLLDEWSGCEEEWNVLLLQERKDDVVHSEYRSVNRRRECMELLNVAVPDVLLCVLLKYKLCASDFASEEVTEFYLQFPVRWRSVNERREMKF